MHFPCRETNIYANQKHCKLETTNVSASVYCQNITSIKWITQYVYHYEFMIVDIDKKHKNTLNFLRQILVKPSKMHAYLCTYKQEFKSKSLDVHA